VLDGREASVARRLGGLDLGLIVRVTRRVPGSRYVLGWELQRQADPRFDSPVTGTDVGSICDRKEPSWL
jgi:hypothetical protein